MRFDLLLAAGAAMLSSTVTALPADQSNGVNGVAALLPQARGPVHDAMSVIQRKGKCGTDFCSSYLHIPAPRTTTRTVTRTVAVTVPASTLTRSGTVTRSAPAVTRTSTALLVVDVTPTVSSTAVVAVPITPTITAFETAVVTPTETVTSFMALLHHRRTVGEETRSPSSSVPIPKWLNRYCADTVSKACSHLVSRATLTRTKTATLSKTVFSGVKTVLATSTVVVTPTANAVVSRTSTRTGAAVTAVVTSTTSSLADVTATAVQTKTVTAPAAETEVVWVPQNDYTFTIRIKALSADDNSPLGYFGPLDGSGAVANVATASDAAIYTVKPEDDYNNIMAPPGSPYPYLGAVFGPNGQEGKLSLADTSYLIPGLVNPVPYDELFFSDGQNSLSAKGLNTYESQVWTMDANEKWLMFTWRNPNFDSVRPNLYLASSATDGQRFLWGYSSFANSYTDGPIQKVTLAIEIVSFA